VKKERLTFYLHSRKGGVGKEKEKRKSFEKLWKKETKKSGG